MPTITYEYTLTSDQIAKLNADTNDGTTNYLVGYQDINSFIANPEQGQDTSHLDCQTKYWYTNAPLVNNPNQSSSAKFYIRDVTSYGLRLDGYPGNNTQKISDDIAHNVIRQVLAGGGLPSISDLLGDDVGTAIFSDNLTIGGWGGSFYCWNETPTGQSMSVGASIMADVQPGESWDGGDEDGLDGQYDKFVAANAGAIADSVPVYTPKALSRRCCLHSAMVRKCRTISASSCSVARSTSKSTARPSSGIPMSSSIYTMTHIRRLGMTGHR